MDMKISFPGGKKVNAELGGFTIATDQPERSGGDGTAPSPFETFLASLGTCAGIYVLGFCQARGISTEGLYLTQSNEFDRDAGRLARVKIAIHLPPGFPDKYREAVRRAAELCAVKKAISDPPEMIVESV